MALALWTRRTEITMSSWRQRRKGLTSRPTSNTYQEFVAVGNQVLECPACPLSSLLGTHVRTFEAKLVLGLPWYCPTLPEVVHREDGSKCTEYSFRCDAPEQLGGQQLDPLVLKLGREHVCYEVLCERLERRFCDAELGLVCACCAETLTRSVCPSCMYAVGWHLCENDARKHFLWKKGTLHAGALDVQRCLFNLHRKLVPTPALREKADAYVAKELISADMANRVLQAIEQERNHSAILNDEEQPANGEPQNESPQLSTRLSKQQMKDLLSKREAMMAEGGGETDQIRVYKHIIGSIERGELLRLMVQASAGTSRHVIVAITILVVIICVAR